MKPPNRIIIAALIGTVLFPVFLATAQAGPWVQQGSTALRHDIQVLADAGIIMAPVMTWPLAWGDIAASFQETPPDMNDQVAAAFRRVKKLAYAEMGTDELKLEAHASATANPIQIRSFEDTPREDAELGLGVNWTGERFAFRVTGEYAANASDGKEWRADGSYAGVALGNWMLSASLLDRWWGPGWQSSLILSNNARPIPAIMFERNSTQAFKSKWLRWIGTWDLTAFWGTLEEEREIPNAKLWGLRIDFRPLKSLEIGLSRTGMICGDGRTCDFKTFWNSFLGKDNAGENVSAEDEPGNQLAGIDLRWSGKLFRQPIALYGQIIGEDEDNLQPSSEMAMFGAETWSYWDPLGSFRFFLEWAQTRCEWRPDRKDEVQANCAYNNGIYKTGYRYRNKTIGHSFDNDAQVFTLGSVLLDNRDNSWLATFAWGDLNKIGAPDPRNPVATVRTTYREIELSHRRNLPVGQIFTGLGYDYRKNTVTGTDDGDVRAFLEWRFGY